MELKNIDRFDFRMGNSFGGIKKVLILFNEENLIIKHNGWNKSSITFTKEECLNDLKKISFENWNGKYINKDKPISENYWIVSLFIDKKEYVYEGLNKFPKDWYLLEEFIKKYTNISLEME